VVATTAVAVVATTAVAVVNVALEQVAGKIGATEVEPLQPEVVPTTTAVPVAAEVEPTTTVAMAAPRADRPFCTG
jgi:hypothetical protein